MTGQVPAVHKARVPLCCVPTALVSEQDVGPGLELAALLEAATRVDGHAPLGEHVMLTLAGSVQVEHVRIASRLDGRLVGYLVLSRTAGGAWYAELVTDPAERGRGVGAGLLLAGRDHVAGHGGGPLRVWAYSSGAPDALADRLGMTLCREVVFQQRALVDLPGGLLAGVATAGAPGVGVPAVGVPAGGVRVRMLRREEAGAWLVLSNAAFAGHPENGGWTAYDLGWRLAAPWTDLDRFVVAVDAATDELLAGVWTKVEPGSGDGELYVVAVRPDQVGRGLGRLVVHSALGVLAARGLRTASLYVDSTNTAALSLYASAGFVTGHRDRCFQLDVPAAG